MPYKLVYFPCRGRAQALRYLCVDNGIPLEEQVVPKEDWETLKPKTLLGQLPVFHDRSFEIAQSNAILRYVARKHKLYGKDDHEATLIDMLNDQQEDVRVAYYIFIYTTYDTEKASFIKSIPEKLAVFEKYLQKNNGGSGYFVGNKASFLDYNLFDLFDCFLVLSSTSLDTLPLLKAFHERLAARDKIAAYRKTDDFTKIPICANGKQ